MIFSFLKLRNAKDYRGLSPSKKLFWYMIIFGGTSLAFYLNFDYKLNKIIANSSFYDPAELSSQKDKDNFLTYYKIFKKEYNSEIIVHLVEGDLFIPKLKNTNLFIGLSEDKEQSMLILPNLINKIVSKEQKSAIENQLLLCKQEQSPPACLSKGLEAVLKILHE